MNVDFPTLGMPATMALTGLFFIPRALSRSIFAAQACFTAASICFISALFTAFILQTKSPFAAKYSYHLSVADLSARSALLSKIRRDLPFAISSISGFLLERGALASRSSMTRSISLMSSCICLFALVM